MDAQAAAATKSTPHGVKRRAEDDPKDDQRLAKRFDLLNLEHNGKIYVPVPTMQPPPKYSRNTDANTSNPSGALDGMQLDDTPHKIYIHSLDDELSEIEAEKGMVFLPDIEKKIGKIPGFLLHSEAQPTADNQLVLYGVPASLTVPEEKDTVRKAIIESRQRASEKALLDTEMEHAAKSIGGTSANCTVGPSDERPMEPQDDVMDLG